MSDPLKRVALVEYAVAKAKLQTTNRVANFCSKVFSDKFRFHIHPYR